MDEQPAARWTPHHLEWDSDQAYDPDTLMPVVPAWRAPYHEAAEAVRDLRNRPERGSDEHL